MWKNQDRYSSSKYSLAHMKCESSQTRELRDTHLTTVSSLSHHMEICFAVPVKIRLSALSIRLIVSRRIKGKGEISLACFPRECTLI